MHPRNGTSTPQSEVPATNAPARPEHARLNDVRSALQQTKDVFGSDPAGGSTGDPFGGPSTPPPSKRPAPGHKPRSTYAQQAARRGQPGPNTALLKGALAASILALLVSVALFLGMPERLFGEYDQEQITLVLQADSLMGAGDYEAARVRFSEVLESQPENLYVRQRLAQLDRLQTAESQLAASDPDDQYRRLVAQGDSLASLLRTVGKDEPILAGQIDAAAREAYLRALVYRPDDQEVRSKLADLAQNTPASPGQPLDEPDTEAERERLRMEQLQQYRQAVEEGDRFMAAGDYLEAQIRFKEALIYQRNDTYAAQRLEMIDALWKEANQNERYDGYLKRGDQLVQAKLFEQARAAYREALAIRPGDLTVVGRMGEIDRLEREAQQQLARQRERERQYQQVLIRGEALTASGQHQAAYDHYAAALKTYPNDTELKQRADSLQAVLARHQQVDENGVYKYLAEDERPRLIGTLGELYARIEYPQSAIRLGLEGRVYVEFVVDEQGTVQNPRILRGLSPDCDREVLRVIRTARFRPGRVDGKPVKAYLALPITFRIQEGEN